MEAITISPSGEVRGQFGQADRIAVELFCEVAARATVRLATMILTYAEFWRRWRAASSMVSPAPISSAVCADDIGEYLACEADRREGHRYRAVTDSRVRAYLLGRREGMLEEAFQHLAGVSGVIGGLVGGL